MESAKVTEYILDVEETTDIEGGEICEGDEDSDWPSYGTEYHNTTIHRFIYNGKTALGTMPKDMNNASIYDTSTFENPEGHNSIIVTKGTYSDGSTFTHEEGRIAFFYIGFDKKKAESIVKQLNVNSKDLFGYFGQLTSVDVEEYPLDIEIKD